MKGKSDFEAQNFVNRGIFIPKFVALSFTVVFKEYCRQTQSHIHTYLIIVTDRKS